MLSDLEMWLDVVRAQIVRLKLAGGEDEMKELQKTGALKQAKKLQKFSEVINGIEIFPSVGYKRVDLLVCAYNKLIK